MRIRYICFGSQLIPLVALFFLLIPFSKSFAGFEAPPDRNPSVMITPDKQFDYAENIFSKTQRELMLQKLATDGVMAIQHEQNPYRLVKKLESFLTPSARSEHEHTFEEIRARVKKLQPESV